MPDRNDQPMLLDDTNPWLVEEYGGHPIEPRSVGEDEDFARIGVHSFILEPAIWFIAGLVLHGTAWACVEDILGYWMVLFVMLPLRLMDTDRPRDWRFRLEYIALQLLALAAGYLGWHLAGGGPFMMKAGPHTP